MVQVDLSIVIQIANFLVLLFILNAILFKPVRKILAERKSIKEGLETSITDLKSKAIETEASIEAGIKAARIAGKKEKELFLQSAADTEKEMIEKINNRAKEDLAAVKNKISKDAGNVKKTLMKELDPLADMIVDKILGRAA